MFLIAMAQILLSQCYDTIRTSGFMEDIMFTQNSQEHKHTHTHPFNGPFSGATWVSRYQKGKTNLDFTEARDSEWQWHQLGHMHVCILLQTDNHTSPPPTNLFLQAGCPSCHPTNSVKALKAKWQGTGDVNKGYTQSNSTEVSTELTAKQIFKLIHQGITLDLEHTHPFKGTLSGTTR